MKHRSSRRRFLGGALACTLPHLLPGFSALSPLVRAAHAAEGVHPRDLEIHLRWNKFLALHTHLRVLATSKQDPPEELVQPIAAYRYQQKLVPGRDIWFTMERYISEARDMDAVEGQLQVFPLEHRELSLKATGREISKAMRKALPVFESTIWPALEERRVTRIDPTFRSHLDPNREKILDFLFSSLNARHVRLRRLEFYPVGRYLLVGYHSRDIHDRYFTIIEVDRFTDMDLLETVIMLVGRIVDIENRGNTKEALNLIRARQASLALPNPSLLPRAVLYWTAGEAVRRMVDAGHAHAGESMQIYERAFRRFVPALAETWNPYLDGKLGLDEAVNELILKISQT